MSISSYHNGPQGFQIEASARRFASHSWVILSLTPSSAGRLVKQCMTLEGMSCKVWVHHALR